ncbi:ABC transporter permease [Maribellus maritimus]|uniref:ABC transporter permease n=1 Tax=Maribellus maritimus TaxID=2870838 RepID=UPI001EEBF4A9|nr:ABC transporter permease [Maribellus maritimus]MCG6188709.1 ABC transporter permease [Maribellus maritimus]
MRTLKIFIRGLKKDSRLNLLNIASMAIGIAAAIIVLGYVYQEFNYDSGYENSNRIFHVLTQNDKNEISGAVTYGPMAQSLKSDFPEIDDATRANFYWGYLAFTAGDNMFNETSIIFADPNFFTLFSFPLINGDAAKCLESPNSIVLSENAAKKYFGETDVIGKQIKIGEDRLFNVGGVYKDFAANSNFRGDIILPLEVISKLTQVWIEPSWNYPTDIHTFILAQNQTEQEAISSKITNYLLEHVEENPEKLLLQPLKNVHTKVYPDWELTPQTNKSYLYLLAIVAFIILAMSAVNFLLLYVGIASKRAIKTGIQKVFGASRVSLFHSHLSEVLFFISLSTIISIIIVILYNYILAEKISFLPSIKEIDRMLFLILSGVIVGFTLLTSIFPAVFASRQKSPEIYKRDEQSLQKQPRIINIMVTGQFAISMALIAVTTLFYKQMNFLEKHNPGFAREELLTIPLNMHIGHGIYNENMDVFCQELKKQSGVKNVTFSYSSPTNIQTSTEKFYCEGMPEGETVNMQWNSVFYDYFETIGVNLVAGRSFSPEFQSDKVDYDNEGKCTYVINEKAAEEMGIDNPVGKILHAYHEGTIIGIVEDFNFRSLHSKITPICFNIDPIYFNEIIIRTNPGVPTVQNQIKSVWDKFVPDYPVEFHYVDDQLHQLYESEGKLTACLNVFAGIAILIACMGLLGLTILSMQKRTKEIGIRKVNGARVSEILTMLNKNFVKWVIIAFVIATPAAYYTMNKWLENFAFKTTLSWWIFALAGLLALGIALLTISWQSWRAATKNPVEVLRYE